MYETWYDNLHPYFGQKNLRLHYIDTDGMFLSVKTQNIIKDSKKLEDIFEFSKLDENDELLSNRNKKVVGKFKMETPRNLWLDEIICLRIKMYVFKCADKIEIKLNYLVNLIQKILNLRNFKKMFTWGKTSKIM